MQILVALGQNLRQWLIRNPKFLLWLLNKVPHQMALSKIWPCQKLRHRVECLSSKFRVIWPRFKTTLRIKTRTVGINYGVGIGHIYRFLASLLHFVSLRNKKEKKKVATLSSLTLRPALLLGRRTKWSAIFSNHFAAQHICNSTCCGLLTIK